MAAGSSVQNVLALLGRHHRSHMARNIQPVEGGTAGSVGFVDGVRYIHLVEAVIRSSQAADRLKSVVAAIFGRELARPRSAISDAILGLESALRKAFTSPW